jgi:hypothetical protein
MYVLFNVNGLSLRWLDGSDWTNRGGDFPFPFFTGCRLCPAFLPSVPSVRATMRTLPRFVVRFRWLPLPARWTFPVYAFGYVRRVPLHGTLYRWTRTVGHWLRAYTGSRVVLLPQGRVHWVPHAFTVSRRTVFTLFRERSVLPRSYLPGGRAYRLPSPPIWLLDGSCNAQRTWYTGGFGILRVCLPTWFARHTV